MIPDLGHLLTQENIKTVYRIVAITIAAVAIIAAIIAHIRASRASRLALDAMRLASEASLFAAAECLRLNTVSKGSPKAMSTRSGQ